MGDFWRDFGPFRWALGLLPLTAVVAHRGRLAPDTPGSAAQLRGPSQHEAVVAGEAEDAAGGVRGEARLQGAVRERERRGAAELCGGWEAAMKPPKMLPGFCFPPDPISSDRCGNAPFLGTPNAGKSFFHHCFLPGLYLQCTHFLPSPEFARHFRPQPEDDLPQPISHLGTGRAPSGPSGGRSAAGFGSGGAGKCRGGTAGRSEGRRRASRGAPRGAAAPTEP